MAKRDSAAPAQQEYSALAITQLEGLEPVRLRPGMYIGSTGSTGLHHLIRELIDNSMDERVVGAASFCEVRLLPNNVVEVEDDGRGIPVDIHPKTGVSALEMVLSRLHAGGKFQALENKDSGYARTSSAGLHGVGIKAVTALSEYLEVEVTRDGGVWGQRYARGVKQSEVERLRDADKSLHGTKFHFKPDAEIFNTIEFDADTIAQRLEEVSYLQPGFTTRLVDARSKSGEPKVREWKSSKGLGAMMERIAKDKNKQFMFTPIKASAERDVTFSSGSMRGKQGTIAIEVWFGFMLDSDDEVVRSFTNNVSTPYHGTHVTGMELGLMDVAKELIEGDQRLRSIKTELTRNDALEGSIAIVSAKLPDPEFEGQTKGKLGNPEVRPIVRELLAESLRKVFEKSPEVRQAIKNKIVTSLLARDAARKAREGVKNKSGLERPSMPGKLADCTESDPETCELWLVEGQSAGGSAIDGRDRQTQAVLALRGKVMNTEGMELNRAFENAEIRDMCRAIGARIEVNRETKEPYLNCDGLRYNKIIIAADADADGDHIRCLLLTFFYRHAPQLIRDGRIFLAQPPLYRVRRESNDKVIAYPFDSAELEQFQKTHNMAGLKVTRFKGLGEMNPRELGLTTMNRQARRLLQVLLYDHDEADRVLDALMGSKPHLRRTFIEEHARELIGA